MLTKRVTMGEGLSLGGKRVRQVLNTLRQEILVEYLDQKCQEGNVELLTVALYSVSRRDELILQELG